MDLILILLTLVFFGLSCVLIYFFDHLSKERQQ